ncbi:Gfo/Idh/MocA family protein [Mariniflexile sp.]|uniref:Gfo/Idh/MocA family protein n=1 Tax=Mariniflexile sp. TaxID=1979402 RepID=UPI00404817F7
MNKVYKWGIIGCGNVTELKSGPAYQKVEGFKLHAVMRRDIEKAQDYALRHGVPKFYSDADDIINDSEIDAIYIATPPDSHGYYALKVAAAGKICCIEKPMAPTYEECVVINKAFNIKNIPLFVSYYRRSLPRFKQIKLWIEENRIGVIRHINWHLSKPVNLIDISKEYNWRTNIDIAYGGYFDDLASHGIDLFIYLLGDIDKATGVSTNQQGLYTAIDSVAGSWIHESGVTGSGSWNFGTAEREDMVHIYGDKGKIMFSVFGETPIMLKNQLRKESITIKNPENVQFFHVQNIKSHLLEKSEHPSPGSTAAHTTWVLENILKKTTKNI